MRAIAYKNDELNITEPFSGLFTQGMVCHETYKNEKGQWISPENILEKGKNNYINKKTGEKIIVGSSEAMSKSKKNVIEPENVIKNYGADSIRWFILSDSPPNRDIQWSDQGIASSYKFIQKIWNLTVRTIERKDTNSTSNNKQVEKFTNKIIYNVTKNLENFQYNVVVANIYEIYNNFDKYLEDNNISNEIIKSSLNQVMLLIMPLIPHIAFECMEKLNSKISTKDLSWPGYKLDIMKENECTIVIQIDGRKRGVVKVPIDLEENTLVKQAKDVANVKKYLNNKTIVKHIYLKNKLINFIV